MELQIKEVAKKKKVTITGLSQKMGVPRRTLYYWIDTNITFEDLNKVADALECNVVELIKPENGFVHWYDGEVYKGMLKV